MTMQGSVLSATDPTAMNTGIRAELRDAAHVRTVTASHSIRIGTRRTSDTACPARQTQTMPLRSTIQGFVVRVFKMGVVTISTATIMGLGVPVSSPTKTQPQVSTYRSSDCGRRVDEILSDQLRVVAKFRPMSAVLRAVT